MTLKRGQHPKYLPYDVLLSLSSQDKAVARPLAERLRADGPFQFATRNSQLGIRDSTALHISQCVRVAFIVLTEKDGWRHAYVYSRDGRELSLLTPGKFDIIELGKRFDYMAYPHRDHGLREGRGTAVHLRMLMVRYLIEHLPPGPR